MQTEPSPTLFDSDHDTPRGLPRGLSSNANSAYQRVIVNPLLAILGWLLAIVLIRYSTRSRQPGPLPHGDPLAIRPLRPDPVPLPGLPGHGLASAGPPSRMPFRGRPLGQQGKPSRPVAINHGPDSLLDLHACRPGNPGLRRVQAELKGAMRERNELERRLQWTTRVGLARRCHRIPAAAKSGQPVSA